jgi:hypothetical protein
MTPAIDEFEEVERLMDAKCAIWLIVMKSPCGAGKKYMLALPSGAPVVSAKPGIVGFQNEFELPVTMPSEIVEPLREMDKPPVATRLDTAGTDIKMLELLKPNVSAPAPLKFIVRASNVPVDEMVELP